MGSSGSKHLDGIVQPTQSEYQQYSYCITNPTAAGCTDVESYCRKQGEDAYNDILCYKFLPARCQTTNMQSGDICDWYSNMDFSWGTVDKTVADFCNVHPTDPKCTCLSSQINCPDKFDSTCVAGGYRNYNMMKQSCPNVLSCDQQVGLSPASVSVLVNAEQNCGTGGTSAIAAGIFDNLEKNLTRPIGGLVSLESTNPAASYVLQQPVYVFVLLLLFIFMLFYASIVSDDNNIIRASV